jgi:LmbE family N-acetylglucosaminyl deacetylase
MKKKILIIEPHSDDSFIGAGGFLQKYKDQYDFYFCLVAASDLELRHRTVTRDERLLEYQNFVDYVGGTWIRPSSTKYTLPLDFDSILDQFPRSTLVRLVEDAILEVKPDVIMTMGPSFHLDHSIVYETVIAATRPTFNHKTETIYIMENPTYVHKLYRTDMDNPNVYVELNEDIIKEKIKAFKDIFKSQIRPMDNYLSSNGMYNWAKYRGIEARCEFAEAFYQYYHRI